MTIRFNRNQRTPLTCVWLGGIADTTPTRDGTAASVTTSTTAHGVGNAQQLREVGLPMEIGRPPHLSL